MSITDDPAVSVRFVVTIDGIELGSFNTCEGLGCEVVLEQREEGGNNGHVWQLPTRLKYSTVKLSRPLTRDTEKVAKWFASMTTGFSRKTAHIEARTGDGEMVARWGLLEVVPVRWTGPTFNPESPRVAIETIEIAHHGYVTEA
ncbi:phage tail protein [Allostreptomyces psammosilenae]|uniref:Phage tail-like protein n=1 Tax=Allostreptomyces psammosilenae TaxID=1892865 RepID=A0A852ZNA7_9ACTN|nr:phage tail protein [Allostreptomyces psammosilenae]NYI03893.1 phage tail-like protein [Allostreptomyces psammosilenae]